MFHENQQIGFYTLIKKLGRGGFGEVWLAERRAKFVTTKVAVKLPLDEQVDHEAIKHEATLWEQASGHPNIVPIIDADEYDGQIVIVSEYAPDGSLEDWLKKHGQMPVERAIETTIQILDGLEFLHSRNIIHRDLKPANILLQGKTPRLADFGISRALRTTVASQSQNISGTFAYMSPEALDGKRSVQTDVWSVGVNLYQFLTGTLPFPQKEPSVLFPAIIMREFAPLPDSIPQNLKNAIAKALAKLPENRYFSAGEMRADLKKILHSISFPQLAPMEGLHKLILPKNIAAPAAFESKTATNEAEQETFINAKSANHPNVTKPFYEQDSVAAQIKEKQSAGKRQTRLEQQRQAEIEQDELERQRWQAAEVKRKEAIKHRNKEEAEKKKKARNAMKGNQGSAVVEEYQRALEERQRTLEETAESKRPERKIAIKKELEAAEKKRKTHLMPLETIIGYFLVIIQLLVGGVMLFSLLIIPFAFIAYLTNNDPATVKNNPTILTFMLLCLLVSIFSALLVVLLSNISPFVEADEPSISSKALVAWLLILLLPILVLKAYTPFTPPAGESKFSVNSNNSTPNKALDNSINKSTNAKTLPSPSIQQKR